jgi:hypothetical protein
VFTPCSPFVALWESLVWSRIPVRLRGKILSSFPVLKNKKLLTCEAP